LAAATGGTERAVGPFLNKKIIRKVIHSKTFCYSSHYFVLFEKRVFSMIYVQV
jgi:hypothetical protein